MIYALVLLALIHPLATAEPWKLCGTGTYTAGSPYETNLQSLLLGTLRQDAYSSPSLFAYGVLGAAPDTVWSLVLCRGDISASACYECVTTAGQDAATACNRSRDVALYYDRCYVRLTNHDFRDPNGNSGEVHVSDGPYIATNEDVDMAVTRLLSATVQHAVGNSSSLFATGQWVGAFGDIYSAAQCAADLSPPECRNCLQTVLRKWWTTFPQGGESATMAGPQCTLRSQLTPFYNGSAMVLLPTTAPIAASGGQFKNHSKKKK
jgi:hypothetical protein